MLKKVFRRKEKGSVLLASLVMVVMLSLMGWFFIYTTITLSAQSQKVAASKQAYYYADAGIELAAERLWIKFVEFGIVPTKLDNFKSYVDYEYNLYITSGGTNYYLDEANFDGKGGKLKTYIKVKSKDAQSVVVTIYSEGNTPPDPQEGKYLRRFLEADVKYYLSGTPLADFSYFTNNYGFAKAAKVGGSVATNGFFRYQRVGSDHVTVAGGDRYRHCVNWEPQEKIDDGGVFSGLGITPTVGGSLIKGYNDVGPNTPNLYAGSKGIPMPSLSQIEFYENSADISEGLAESASVPEPYGIYVWVDAGSTIYDEFGVGDENYGPGGVLDTGQYIKVCDAVYGDDVFSYDSGSGPEKVYYCSGSNEWRPGEKDNLIVSNSDPAHPIKIYGTVVVQGNAVIEGTIQGCGSVYTGRNIYCPDGLSYARPPDTFRGFTNTNSVGDCDGQDTIDDASTLNQVRLNQKTWLENNQPGSADDPTKKDLVGLFATENIIVGDITRSPYIYGGNPSNSPSYAIIDGLLNQTGNIVITRDNGTTYNQSTNFNITDESALGTDQVPNTRTKETAEEYIKERNNYWDVSFYTADNPPPSGATNPYSGNPCTTIDPNSPPGGPWSGWSQTYKDAVIPGSGEDLDGDGRHDGQMDLYEIVAFSPTDAQSLRSTYGSYTNTNDWNTYKSQWVWRYKQIETNPAVWNSKFQFNSADWGGNLDLSSSTVNLGNLSGDSFPSEPSWTCSSYGYAWKIDALTYTNHAWGGVVETNINGGFIARLETIYLGGQSHHDDRILGGGESVYGSGVQVPQIEHMEVVRWQE